IIKVAVKKLCLAFFLLAVSESLHINIKNTVKTKLTCFHCVYILLSSTSPDLFLNSLLTMFTFLVALLYTNVHFPRLINELFRPNLLYLVFLFLQNLISSYNHREQFFH